MAQHKQRMKMKVELEDLVDMFLEDKLDVDLEGHEPIPKESIFGEEESDGVPCHRAVSDSSSDVQSQENANQDLVRQKLGRSFAFAGDQLWRSHTGSVSKDALQVEIAQMGQLTDSGEISAEQEEEHWKRFKEMLDKALEDIGPHNPYRMMVAVLVTVRGLSNFGSSVRMLARRFTLRFFEEHRLKLDIERAGGIEHLGDDNLD